MNRTSRQSSKRPSNRSKAPQELASRFWRYNKWSKTRIIAETAPILEMAGEVLVRDLAGNLFLHDGASFGHITRLDVFSYNQALDWVLSNLPFWEPEKFLALRGILPQGEPPVWFRREVRACLRVTKPVHFPKEVA